MVGLLAVLLPGPAFAALPPVVDSIVAAPPSVLPNSTATIRVEAHDPDCAGTCTTGCGAYLRQDLVQWSASGGTITATRSAASASPFWAEADWTAPAVEGSYRISVSLSDTGTFMCGGRQTTTAQANVLVTTNPNRPPVVGSLTADRSQLYPEEESHLICAATDADGDPVSYAWSADTGTLSSSGATATFVGSRPGIANVTCAASDGRGGEGSASVALSLSDAVAEYRISQNLAAPQRVAVDSLGAVYAVDAASGGIAGLNLDDGSLVYRLRLENATSVAVDWADRLLVGQAGLARVLTRAGGQVLVLAPAEDLGRVADVAVDLARRRYAVLFGDTARVVVFDEDGATLAAIGGVGDGPAQFRHPRGVAFTPGGQLAVADTGHGQIHVLELDGTPVTTMGGRGGGAGKFVGLDDVDVDANGIVYASDSFNSWVQAFDPDGTLREVFGSYGGELGRFKTPAGIAASLAEKSLVVASLNGPTLEVYRLAGQVPPIRQPLPAVTPSALTFPGQQAGTTSAPRTVFLSNLGNAALGIRRVTLTGDYTLSGACDSFLDPGASCELRVAFSPLLAGSHLGALEIQTSGEPRLLTVALSGEAFVPPLPPPFASLWPAGSLSFPPTYVGAVSVAHTLTLANTGGQPLIVSRVEASAGFSVATSCGTLLTGTSCPIDLRFAPSAAGDQTGSLVVESNAANGTQGVALAGRGLPRSFEAQPAALDFGVGALGSRGTPQSVRIRNVGGRTLRFELLLGGSDAPEFVMVGKKCARLSPGGACTVRIAFKPTRVGEALATLQVRTDLEGIQDLASLRGTGEQRAPESIFRDDFESGSLDWSVVDRGSARLRLDSAAADAVGFGVERAGRRQARLVTLVNPGTWPIDVTRVSLSPGAFALSEDRCTGAPLYAGESCDLLLIFAPLAVGPAAATLEVETDRGPFAFAVSGTGQR